MVQVRLPAEKCKNICSKKQILNTILYECFASCMAERVAKYYSII